MIRFGHVNLRVRDLEASIHFYEEQLNLHFMQRVGDGDGPMAWLGDGISDDFFLELTQAQVGCGKGHIAFVTDERAKYYPRHKGAGIVDYEIPALGIYFIHDPDGNSIEMMPKESLEALGGKKG